MRTVKISEGPPLWLEFALLHNNSLMQDEESLPVLIQELGIFNFLLFTQGFIITESTRLVRWISGKSF
jgi:hypothetical protein